jgi:hypothetical protein
MSDVTQILSAIEKGDPHAAEQLLPLVYDELRKLAAQKLAQEAPGQTLQATVLVHEAYIRLVDTEQRYGHPARRRTGSEGCSPPMCFLCGVLIKCRVFFPHLQINRGRVQGQETARPVLEV